jgi:superfamily II DNA or RNA helicase
MTKRSFTLATLNRDLPAAYIARGKHYADAGRVGDLRYFSDKNRYTAAVQGSRPEPYRVEAQMVNGSLGPIIYGLCTCPVRVNCKHVAAMLWKALDGKSDEKKAEKSARVMSVKKPRSPPPLAVPFDLSLWLEGAQRITHPDNERATAAADRPQCLLYLIEAGASSATSKPMLKLVSARRLKNGDYGRPTRWSNVCQALSAPPRFVSADDQRILRMLLIGGDSAIGGEFRLQGESGAEILRAVLATGRCHWAHTETPPLREAPVRKARATWAISDSGRQRVVFETEPGAKVILPLSPPYYVDVMSNECGAVDTGLSAAVVEMLVHAPEIAPEHATIAREALSSAPGVANVPLPIVPEQEDRRDIVPVPWLRLLTMQVFEGFRGRYRGRAENLDVAVLTFDYAGARAGRDSPGMLTRFSDGKVLRIKRDHVLEKKAHAALADAGFIKVMNAARVYPDPHKHDYALAGEPAWLDFLMRRLPQLRALGWQIDIDESFRHAIVEAGDWLAEVKESGRDWFELSLQLEVEGSRVDLVPLLLTVIRERPELLSRAKGQNATAEGYLFVRLESGRLLSVPFARLQPLVAVLRDLLDAAPSGKLRLPRLDALRLADLDDSTALTWQGGEALRVLGHKLAGFTAIAPVTAPANFGAHLRPYQEQGLAWLQFLRDYSLGGILADDMGLGKTVQTLAHILIEKMAGRLAHPVLVVAPTSVIPNWKAEAARFAPQLRVHVSHGVKRKEAFGEMAASDLVLTTYALLPRDEQALLGQQFHLVVLDEAQQIKNTQTRAARVVGQLRANHRLCLTGTPLENHLGELWSLFHFLMPGLLGDAATFRRAYRTPIEKHADAARRENLVRRIRPFILRRTKDQVAPELPPKSEILRPVELAGPQRELYETVRASVHERVRAEIATRGIAQSHIVVLDALLKLRQICCDPRLLKVDAARHVKESAKLQLLLEMLQELLPEGRRVLIFSQFTSMLDLIEPELAKLAMGHVKLTGQTRDRERPVKAFQSGKVPLFLISLKAGGTGLNLTAADTVIHYDPWWNPAVENQASGRAHRIGQDKPVFIYKLIVSGSVEEKIATLQASKAALARSVLDNDAGASLPLTPDDIQALFEPMR